MTFLEGCVLLALMWGALILAFILCILRDERNRRQINQNM